MRHCISFLLPKICGKELLKDGAAWMAGKLIFPGTIAKMNNDKEPRDKTWNQKIQQILKHKIQMIFLPMQSLSVKPKMPLTWLNVTCFSILTTFL